MNRYSDTARLAFHFAWTEADNLGATAVGVEHLLLGLLQQKTAASTALKSAGVTLADVRRKVSYPKRADATPLAEETTPEVEEVMRVVAARTEARQNSSIEPEDLLLTMLELYGASNLQDLVGDTEVLRQQLSREGT